ncbi:DUF3489 domain-containing protein [Parablastomonas sp. CN1-191]|uniref:DUF3489 domain-containing protein n=1 Tax=Parablastomonas sp. CN1-191 TaxID=3400908 RepID=UPI003BF8512F
MARAPEGGAREGGNYTPGDRKPTKASLILKLISRSQGATIEQMIEATGWLPHTIRAALTGLRKRGVVIERQKGSALTTYIRR